MFTAQPAILFRRFFFRHRPFPRNIKASPFGAASTTCPLSPPTATASFGRWTNFTSTSGKGTFQQKCFDSSTKIGGTRGQPTYPPPIAFPLQNFGFSHLTPYTVPKYHHYHPHTLRREQKKVRNTKKRPIRHRRVHTGTPGSLRNR